MSKLYGIIFDVDGVIADTEAVNAKASIKVFADLFGVKNVQRKDFEKGLGRGAEEYVKAAATVHGIELTDQQVEQATKLRQQYFLKVLEQNPLPAFPGVLELIEAGLEHKDFHVAIATSSTRRKSEAVLCSAKIPYKKMVYITGSDVKNKKPHPELFQKAVDHLGLEPGNCVVIEDAPNGIEAAQAARCKCIGVTNSQSTDMAGKLTKADLVVNSLAEINIADLRSLIEGKIADYG